MLSITIVAAMNWPIFIWATSYIETAIAAALFELWPFVWFFGLRFVDRNRCYPIDHRRTSAITYVLMAFGMPAIALIIFSTADTSNSGTLIGFSVLGMSLALIAPIVGGSETMGGHLFSDRLLYGYGRPRSEPDQDHFKLYRKVEGRDVSELLIVFATFVFSRAVTAPILLLVAISDSGASFDVLSTPLFQGFLVGFFLTTPAAALLRYANDVTARREIASIQYASPILGIFWLWLFVGIDVNRIDFLMFGTVAIVMLNMLINADPEVPDIPVESALDEDVGDGQTLGIQPTGILPEESPRDQADLFAQPVRARYRLKVLVASLLGVGMFIYFRDELFREHDFSWNLGDYWNIIAVASTVFALLLAFRLTRVETLLLNEDDRTLSLIRHVEMLPDRFFVGENDRTNPNSKRYLVMWIRRLNAAETLTAYRSAYNYSHVATHNIATRIASNEELEISDEMRIHLAHIQKELDALALGRQSAREFGERIALWLVGVTIVVFCLVVPRQASDWARFLSELFAIVLASIVLFLLTHLADIRRSRGNELLMDPDPNWRFLDPKAGNVPEGRLYVRFANQKDVSGQRILSSALILVIVSAVVVLLALRRLGGL